MPLRALRLLLSSWNQLRSGKRPNGRPVRPRLMVEALETRLTPSTLTVLADADARVERSSASRNYGASSELVSDNSPQRETFLRYSVGEISGPIQSAKVRVYVTDGSSNGPAIYATNPGWSENSITWTNRPPRVGGPLDDKGAVGTGWLEL